MVPAPPWCTTAATRPNRHAVGSGRVACGRRRGGLPDRRRPDRPGRGCAGTKHRRRDEYVFQALRNGASGFLGKGVEPADLLDAIRLVAAGEALLSPRATKALIARYLAPPDPANAFPPELDSLTEREREVLTLVAGGLSNDAIAERLHVSPLTAKTHVNHIMTKLGARDRAQLVVIAYQTGFARPHHQ